MKATAVKERPILFSAPMVRAILDGRKTQTRRVVKPQPIESPRSIVCDWFEPSRVTKDGEIIPGEMQFGFWSDDDDWKCPYGSPGERLWVRETWTHTGSGVWQVRDAALAQDGQVLYRATDSEPCKGCWFPSIHMPRWASRITLEITDVRVERLQDISEEDAKAEGVDETCVLPGDQGSFVSSFAYLWNQINGEGSWESNHWVWVVSFKQLKEFQ